MSQKKSTVSSRSMTGFGRASVQGDSLQLDVEIRTVNSRYLDFFFRMPKIYNRYERDLRELLSESLQRGRVEVSITRTLLGDDRPVRLDKNLAKQYFELGHSVCDELGVWNDTVASGLIAEIINRREILDREEEEILDEEGEKESVLHVTKLALEQLCEMRKEEGVLLNEDITSRLLRLETLRQDIAQHVQGTGEEIQQRLHEKISALIDDANVDSERLALEVAVLVEKTDVTEELTRLTSHFQQMTSLLREYPQGRKGEFLIQEIGREFNTIASKTQHAEVQQKVVEAKAELEKIREQIQNIE